MQSRETMPPGPIVFSTPILMTMKLKNWWRISSVIKMKVIEIALFKYYFWILWRWYKSCWKLLDFASILFIRPEHETISKAISMKRYSKIVSGIPELARLEYPEQKYRFFLFFLANLRFLTCIVFQKTKFGNNWVKHVNSIQVVLWIDLVCLCLDDFSWTSSIIYRWWINGIGQHNANEMYWLNGPDSKEIFLIHFRNTPWVNDTNVKKYSI